MTDLIAVAYLARGAGDEAPASFRRFLQSYTEQSSGLPHKLYIIYKGFATTAAIEIARTCFRDIAHEEIFTDDLGFDIGAYRASLKRMTCDTVCFLNTHSEPVSPGWLLKLAKNLALPDVGLVGASGSFEAHEGLDPRFPPFPNIHIRTNAFMLRRDLAEEVFGTQPITTKLDAYLAESGENGITRQVEAIGKAFLIVGRDGRGYTPRWWSTSRIFRQGEQRNLLVHDNETRRFAALPWGAKRQAYLDAWGPDDAPTSRFS